MAISREEMARRRRAGIESHKARCSAAISDDDFKTAWERLWIAHAKPRWKKLESGKLVPVDGWRNVRLPRFFT